MTKSSCEICQLLLMYRLQDTAQSYAQGAQDQASNTYQQAKDTGSSYLGSAGNYVGGAVDSVSLSQALLRMPCEAEILITFL
jgi:hypothetical protein